MVSATTLKGSSLPQKYQCPLDHGSLPRAVGKLCPSELAEALGQEEMHVVGYMLFSVEAKISHQDFSLEI